MRIWKTQSIGRNTKINLFKTLVRPVLLYGRKAWKITKTEEGRLDRFQFTCFRKIPKYGVRNETISEITGVNTISSEIRRRRWNWIGHVLRKERNNDCMVAMEWQPEGRKKLERPKITWRKTARNKRNQEGWSS